MKKSARLLKNETTERIRRKAEERLNDNTAFNAKTTNEAETLRLLHELQIQIIELEVQNETLWQMKAENDEQLRRYSELYNDLYDSAPVGYCTVSREDGVIIKTNLTAALLLGVERDNLIGQRFSLIVSGESRPVVNALFEKVFVRKETGSCNAILLRSWQEPFWAHIEANPRDNGRTCRVVLMDITESKKMELALHQNQALLYSTLQTLPEGVLVLDSNLAIRMSNKNAQKILGLTASQIIEQRPLDPQWKAIHEDGRPIADKRSPLTAVLRAGQSHSNLIIGIHKPDGSMHWISLRFHTLLSDNGSDVHGSIISLTEINDSKEERSSIHALSQATTTTTDSVESGLANTNDFITIATATQGNILLDVRNEIAYLEGAKDYTLFITHNGKQYLTFGALGKWAQRLHQQGFIRVHRSYIVNFRAIYSWQHQGKIILLTMQNGAQIPVSRGYKAHFLSSAR